MSDDQEIGCVVQTRQTFYWIIRDFFSLTDQRYFSPDFDFADTEWYLSLWPNDVRGGQGGVSIYLHRSEKEKGHESVSIRFGVRVPCGVEEREEIRHVFSKRSLCYGIFNFLSRSDLSHRRSTLMPNNELVITCDMRSDDYTESNVKEVDPFFDFEITPKPKGAATLVGEKKCLKGLLGMLESGEDSDVVLRVRGKEFPAHRNVLRARSAVFRSMFGHEMAERRSGVVDIEDCDPGTFKDFLVYLYSGSYALSSENVYILYTCADKYDFGELKEACSDFMRGNVTVASFCHVFTLAVKHNEKDLTECARKFFCKNSVDIAKTTEWQTFLTENPTVANELFIKAMSK